MGMQLLCSPAGRRPAQLGGLPRPFVRYPQVVSIAEAFIHYKDLLGSVGGGMRYTVSDRTRITLDAFYSRAPSYEWGTAQAGLEIIF